jgi:hypothetical protein
VTERGSAKHSPRLDEQLKGEVESLTRGAPVEARADERLQMEAAAEGEPEPDAVVSVDDVELRSLLAFSVRPSAFPGDRERLLEVAREEGAQQRVIDWLQRLPAARVFPTVQSVWDELGGTHEQRGAAQPLPPRSGAVEQTPIGPAAERTDHRHQPERDQRERDQPDGEPSYRNELDRHHPNADQSLVCRAAQAGLAIASIVVGLAVGAARTVLRRPWP